MNILDTHSPQYSLRQTMFSLRELLNCTDEVALDTILAALTARGWTWEQALVVKDANGDRHYLGSTCPTFAHEVMECWKLDRDMRARGWL